MVVTVPSGSPRNVNDVEVYTDGVAETWAGGTGTWDITGTGQDIYVGAQSNTAANPWAGDISDVAVYPKALDAAEALALYNGQKLATNFGGDIDTPANITGASLHAGDGETLTITIGDDTYDFVDGILTSSN